MRTSRSSNVKCRRQYIYIYIYKVEGEENGSVIWNLQGGQPVCGEAAGWAEQGKESESCWFARRVYLSQRDTRAPLWLPDIEHDRIKERGAMHSATHSNTAASYSSLICSSLASGRRPSCFTINHKPVSYFQGCQSSIYYEVRTAKVMATSPQEECHRQGQDYTVRLYHTTAGPAQPSPASVPKDSKYPSATRYNMVLFSPFC